MNIRITLATVICLLTLSLAATAQELPTGPGPAWSWKKHG